MHHMDPPTVILEPAALEIQKERLKKLRYWGKRLFGGIDVRITDHNICVEL